MRRITALVSRRRSALFLALAAALLGVYLGRERLVSSPAPKYVTARVARADLENVVLATGTLQPIRQVDVGTRATGQVKSLKVKLGDHVRAGDLLAEIDPVLAESALQEAQAKLADLEAQKRSAVAKFRKSRLESERQHGLIRGAATSNRDVETADAQRQADEASLASLDAQISQARSRIKTETANVSYTKILAPIDGEVVAVLTQEGQTVVASQIVPVILKLAQLDRMIVKTQIGEADIDGVKVGQSASFVTMSDPAKRYYGTLRVVDVVPQSYSELGGSSSAGASQGKAAGAAGGAEREQDRSITTRCSTFPIPTGSCASARPSRFPSFWKRPRACSRFPRPRSASRRRTVVSPCKRWAPTENCKRAKSAPASPITRSPKSSTACKRARRS